MGDTVPQFDSSSSLEVHGHPALCVHAKLRNAVNFEEVESIRMPILVQLGYPDIDGTKALIGHIDRLHSGSMLVTGTIFPLGCQ